MKKIVLLLLIAFVNQLQSQNIDPLRTKDFEAQQIWVDSILNTMTIDEKIGQLFMIQAYSNKDKKHEDIAKGRWKMSKAEGLSDVMFTMEIPDEGKVEYTQQHFARFIEKNQWGGLGGRYAITTRSLTSGSMVLRHELGHNFSNVGEEYDGGQVYSGANFSRTKIGVSIA